MSEIKNKLSVWTARMVTISLLLPFFTIPHTLEDFALGEPAKNGVPAPVLAFVIATVFALQALALYWAGQGNRRSYFVHMGIGAFWSLAAGIAQLPVIFASSAYRSGAISVIYVAGMVVLGVLLVVVSFAALKTRDHE